MRLTPAGLVPPEPIDTDRFRLRPLGPEHNESDHAAWTSSIAFIRGLPGWESSSWPTPMSLSENLRDCTSHLTRAQAGEDFAFTVLLPDRDEVLGC